MNPELLIIDDEISIVNTIKRFFQTKNFNITFAQLGGQGLKKFKSNKFDVVLLDLNLPDISGEEIAKEIRKIDKDIIIMVITAYGSIKSSVDLFKIGVNDYILKPFQVEELYFVIENFLKNKEIKDENVKLKKNLAEIYKPKNLVGESKSMKEIYNMIIQVAPVDVNVLIQGASGTGKEIVARTIHFFSSRKDKPFYAINCGAIPSELLESEMFGYRKGSFTGAIQDRKGLFEEASQSTLFLDEINEMPLMLQPKLLRVLQEKKIKRIGDNKEIDADVRIVAASSKDLKREVADKKFREDLFYRLNVFTINLDPLKERQEDIPLLINHFIQKYNKALKKEIKAVTKGALEKCIKYRWPGNIRELENIIQRAMVVATSIYIKSENIIFDHEDMIDESGDITINKMDYKTALKTYMDNIDKLYIQKALQETDYNKLKSAKILGISPRALHYKIKKFFPKKK